MQKCDRYVISENYGKIKCCLAKGHTGIHVSWPKIVSVLIGYESLLWSYRNKSSYKLGWAKLNKLNGPQTKEVQKFKGLICK